MLFLTTSTDVKPSETQMSKMIPPNRFICGVLGSLETLGKIFYLKQLFQNIYIETNYINIFLGKMQHILIAKIYNFENYFR